MLRKKIYKWHRNCSIIIAVPVILWALSGFMHPIMTNIRPKIFTQSLVRESIDTAKIKVSLQEALRQNAVNSFSNVRLVHMDTNWFYQVRLPGSDTLLYISSEDGKVLRNGDRLYAQYLAEIFLKGRSSFHKSSMSDVKDVSMITTFDNVYQAINRLLPVYEVSFERSDGIRIYVETAHDRFSFAADNKRAFFSNIFVLVHTWKWLAFLGTGKLLVEIFLSGLAFVTTLMGIYIFFSTSSKKGKGNRLVKARRRHRFISIIISLFTLMFTFSGCYHAFSKLSTGTDAKRISNIFSSSQVHLDVARLQQIVQKPIVDISLISMQDTAYWQVYTKTVPGRKTKDLMKDMGVAAPAVVYVQAEDYNILKDGDAQYADYLATKFSGRKPGSIQSTVMITHFTDDYDFADKLLPVWKVSYASDHHQRYYVETTDGRLSKVINDIGSLQEYSFAFLHKHEFLAGFGQGVKDFSTMFWAAAQVLMAITGLVLYLRWWQRRRKKVR